MNTDQTKTTITILLLSVLAGLAVGVVAGIELYELSATRLGFWESKVEPTYIALLSLRHQIQGSDTIRTSLTLGNIAVGTVTLNCTLYYKASNGNPLAQHSFNTTINAGQTHNEAFLVTPINVSQFAGTDISIYEY